LKRQTVGREAHLVSSRRAIDAEVGQMIERLCSGDSEAWSEFLERYRRLIYSAIHRANTRFDACWDETAQEELFEEAVFKLLRRNGKALRSWKGACKIETWVYRIVRNVCIDRLRKDGRREEVCEADERTDSEARLGSGTGASPEANRDLRISLEQAIARTLEEREAIVIRLIYFEGFTYREVAERLGMTVGAMSGLVYRALAKLREDGGVARHWEGD
jgi:RNA polymerase sigma-70 factor (ECF subfamily)